MRLRSHPRTVLATRLLATAAAAALVGLSLAACKTTGSDITGSIGSSSHEPRTEAEWRRSLQVWGERYQRNPGDAEAAIHYARALRATEQRAQAVAVLEQASIRHPTNKELLGDFGRSLAEAGQYGQALDTLRRAHTPDNPDWRILNAQGAVLDQVGRHKEAQRQYAAALKMVPDEASVLSNLGLSYALEKRLKRAEATLRKAAGQPDAQPKVRQNLALVVGLQGRMAEAEKIAGDGLPPEVAAANVRNLREMLADRDGWKKMGRQRYGSSPDAGT